MKLLVILISTFGISFFSSAQTISRYVIPTNGSEYKDSNIHVSATVGETFTFTLNNNNITATQGFQQPDHVPGGGNVTMHLKLFLHGYYDNNGLMQKVLYNQSVVSDPASVLADSVTVELHAASYPYSMIKTTTALLHTNGTLTCSFPNDVLGAPYYIVIHHRNTIETWSAAPMTITADMTYDFTTAASKAYANNQVDVSGNGTIWAMFTADLNQDQNVDLLDMPILEDDIALYMYGYTATDLNGDGNTDLLDVIYLDYGIANYVFSYHP